MLPSGPYLARLRELNLSGTRVGEPPAVLSEARVALREVTLTMSRPSVGDLACLTDFPCLEKVTVYQERATERNLDFLLDLQRTLPRVKVIAKLDGAEAAGSESESELDDEDNSDEDLD